MRARRWAALVALYLVVILFLTLGPVGLDQARANEAEEQQLLELINKYRQENGVAPLVPSGTLSTSAEHHSKDMSDHDFFSHRTKESSHYPADSGPADRMAQEGYPTDAATAENIAWGQPTAEEVFDDWRRSPEHDAVMLDGQYTAAGVGHVGTYWTADFGSVSDSPLTIEAQKPAAENKAPDVEQAPARRTPAEPVAEEQNPTPQPADEANDEQANDGQESDGQTRIAEAPLTTEPGKEIRTIVDMGHEAPQRTAGFEAETPDAEQPSTESASEPVSEPVSEPAATEQPAGSPSTDLQTSIKETAKEETRAGEISPDTEPGGEATSGTPAEQPLTDQTALPQPGMQPSAGERPTGEQEQQAETLPILGPGGEAVPQLVPTQPATEGPATERDTTGETGLAETLRPPGTGSTITEPDAGTTAQSIPTAITEQDIRKASPVETEAMEAALAPRDAIPENLVRREPSTPTEESPVGIPAALRAAPATLASAGASGALDNTPAAVKALPRTSGAPTLPLFVGGFLLLSGVLIYGASRRQRGR
jgi:hypothetical protein